MAEAIFTGKEVEEFSAKDGFTFLAFADTEFMGLGKDLFMRHRPGNAGDWNRKNK